MLQRATQHRNGKKSSDKAIEHVVKRLLTASCTLLLRHWRRGWLLAHRTSLYDNCTRRRRFERSMELSILICQVYGCALSAMPSAEQNGGYELSNVRLCGALG